MIEHKRRNDYDLVKIRFVLAIKTKTDPPSFVIFTYVLPNTIDPSIQVSIVLPSTSCIEVLYSDQET